MAKCFRSECPNVRASGAFFIFRLRLSAAFNLLAQMKGIQKRLPYGQADAFRQCPAVNRELCPVAPGKRRLIAHPVGFVIDDNKPPVLHKNAVRNALHKHLLVGDFSRQPFVAFARREEKGKFIFPQQRFALQHPPCKCALEEGGNTFLIHSLALCFGEEAMLHKPLHLRTWVFMRPIVIRELHEFVQRRAAFGRGKTLFLQKGGAGYADHRKGKLPFPQ